MRISLVPLNGGRPFVVTVPLALVGRSEACDWRLEDEGVADVHCVLAQADNLLLLRDLGTGCTRVNGQRVRRAVLLQNDQLTLASSSFRVDYEEGPA
jgi:predicted component of type VI protein secretion system